MIYSHEGVELIEHLQRVREIGLAAYEEKKKLKLPCHEQEIKTALGLMLFLHDIGKATKFFQQYLKDSIENILSSVSKEKRSHSKISALYAAYLTSKKLADSKDRLLLSLIVYLAISKHHGDLADIGDMLLDLDESLFKEQFASINFAAIPFENNVMCDDVIDFYYELNDYYYDDFEAGYNDYLLCNFFFSILIYADKYEATFHTFVSKQEIPKVMYSAIDIYKKEKFKNKDKTISKLNHIREEIYTIVENSIDDTMHNNIVSINVPTGSGKTLTAFNYALKVLQKDDSLQRIIYTLPFTSIVDQTDEIIREALRISKLNPDDYLYVHHHLAEARIKVGEDYLEGNEAQFLIENWDKPLILTTLWQILNSLLTKKNQRLRKFHNIANSIIIFDEVQAVPIYYWKLLKELLQVFSHVFNCKIVFMTATMPIIFQEEKNEIVSLIPQEKRNEYFNSFSRYKVEILHKLQPISMDELFSKAVSHIQTEKEKNFLFVFNTIDSCLKFHNLLAKEIGNESIVYLSGMLDSDEKANRIACIKKSEKRKIIISTQLVEAGVDIDCHIVYRDFASFDSIVQAAGRSNRNANPDYSGEVYIFKLQNEQGRKYCNFIYKQNALVPTENIFEVLSEFTENTLLNVIEQYYHNVLAISSQSKSDNLIKLVQDLKYKQIDEEFELIEDIPTSLVFIERNDEASNVLREFKNVICIDDRWERKNAFLKIKARFYRYIISVKTNTKKFRLIENFEEVGNLRVITRDMLVTYYNEYTGFTGDYENYI